MGRGCECGQGYSLAAEAYPRAGGVRKEACRGRGCAVCPVS